MYLVDGMALNDSMYMYNVVARRAGWQPNFPPRQKNIFLYFRAKFLFSTYQRKAFDFGQLTSNYSVIFFKLFYRNRSIFEKLIAPNRLVLRN